MTGKRIEIQWLRALAAVEVAVCHSDLLVKGFSDFRIMESRWYGPVAASGVELFFIISGFIMGMQAARFGAVGEFVVSRVLRIFPMYWLATSVVVAVGVLVPGWRLGAFSTSAETLARSYLILPGWGFPILGVGWTLEYEMVFYLFVAVLIGLGLAQRGRCLGFSFLLAGLALVGCVVGPRAEGSSLLFHVFSPYMFAFGLGWLLHGLEGAAAGLKAMSATAFAAIAVLAVLLGPAWGDALVLRIAAMAVLFLLVLRLRARLNANTALNRFMNRVGDASYVLYLSHWFVLSAAGKVLGVLGIPAWLDMPVRVAGIMASVGLALAAHRLVEKPIDHWLRPAVSRTLRRAAPT